MASSRAALTIGPIVSVVAVVAALAVLSATGGWWLGGIDAASRTGTVIDVVDGDTIVVALAAGRTETVRLLGVDTPETVHPERGVECFGPEASAFTRSELSGRTVELETDVERRDHYGRLLAHVYVNGESFNERLLALGYGRLLVIVPNRAHGRRMLERQIAARRAGLGLWSECESR